MVYELKKGLSSGKALFLWGCNVVWGEMITKDAERHREFIEVVRGGGVNRRPRITQMNTDLVWGVRIDHEGTQRDIEDSLR